MDRKEEILRICSLGLRRILERLSLDFEGLQEIRLRAGLPMTIRTEQGDFFVKQENGELTREVAGALCIPAKEIRETLEYVGNYSLYAYEEEIRQGFITVQGGHRIGVAGKAVVEDGHIRTMKNITFLHIRIAHEKRGCADNLLPWLYEKQQERWHHSLILSPPGCGKTTMLRDLIRQVSLSGFHVSVVDERSELAACYLGIPQNDLGPRTDVLDGCPKTEGMLLLLRSMAPQVLAVDEIGDGEELEAVRQAAAGGCSVLATAHGGSVAEVMDKWSDRLRGRTLFEQFVVLSRAQGAGTIEEIRDGTGVIRYIRKEEGTCG